jgi:polyhydroxyalkanoate synthesis regulator phasin
MLQGSIEAGNTAKEIIKEAVELLTILQAAGKISKEEADDFVDILNSI